MYLFEKEKVGKAGGKKKRLSLYLEYLHPKYLVQIPANDVSDPDPF